MKPKAIHGILHYSYYKKNTLFIVAKKSTFARFRNFVKRQHKYQPFRVLFTYDDPDLPGYISTIIPLY
jgi:hypothetical protein